MYIYAFSNHYEVVKEQLSNKKALLKKRINRSDNFVNLALLGVEKCLKEHQLKEETHLYISSQTGNINTTMKVFEAIFQKQQLPMPFNFLNSVNASILFFVAKNFGIKGKAIFTDSFESALTQALVDIQNNKTVLVGVVDEAISDLEKHKEKFQTNREEEHSSWVLLSPNIESLEPLAKIEAIKLEVNDTRNFNKQFFQALENLQEEKKIEGEFLSLVVKKC